MPIKIYWGPPGSYKTSSAVVDEVARCAREGRVLVTNMRGLTRERIIANAPGITPEAAEKFQVVHLRMDNPDDLHKLRTWPWWAPFGAYFVLDEVQAIYPPDWSAAKLAALDSSSGRLWPSGENMPTTISLCFDMHRHGNWDFCFTTPNIKKVLPVIRAAAECAYKHKNLGMLGISGRYAQGMHLAEDNGNAGDMYGIRWRKIPKWAFECYDSTATGAVSDTRAGWNIFANPRLLLLFGVIGIGLAYLLYRGGDMVFGGKSGRADVPAAPAAAPVPLSPTAQVVRGSGQRVDAPSDRWRLVSVVELAGGRMIFHVASGKRFQRISDRNCGKGELGWFCRVEDGVATIWTGPDPIADAPPPAAPMISAAIAS
ncbi:MAG TPA: zonular occludens toxin domain-containing protein [Solimonas sp.]